MTYTEEISQKIIAQYLADPCRATVEQIAKDIGKSERSVVAKLSSAGVYVTPVRKTKTGEDIITKEEMVKDICTWLGEDMPTLVKTGKMDLRKLHLAIQDFSNA